MKLITEDNLNKIITKQYSWNFNLEENGLYLIEIIASAKSWWQNVRRGRAFFKDDDIFLFLDEQELTTSLNQKKDARSAWNGNELKDKDKTVIIATKLLAGKHTITLRPDQSPFIKSISVSQVAEKSPIFYIPASNSSSQKSPGRPWLSYIILDLLITKLSISARAPRSKKDDDDIKLLINGVIQRNENPKAHRDWYWCGQVLKGEDKIFSLSNPNNSNSKQFNIDLYSDGSPRLNRIELGFKRIPTVDDPEWTENFYDDTPQMILARAIFGEGRSLPDEGKAAIGWAIRNRVEDGRWANNYHGVILQDRQYSAFNEGDSNLEYVRNPFYVEDPSQKVSEKNVAAWVKCYEIAGLVMAGKIKDPTGGANHYFSNFIDYPSWTKSPEAEFKLKIVNTLFYDLKPKGKKGFVEIKYIILVLLIILIILGVFLAGLWISGNDEIGSACGVRDEPTEENIGEPSKEPGYEPIGYFDHLYINPKTSEVEKILFGIDGKFSGLAQLTNDGYYKSNLQLFSSDGPYYGYFQSLHKDSDCFDESNEKERENYYRNYTALMIDKGYGSIPFEVYRGDVHTSSWKWEDINHVKVYNNCGTCCRYYFLINIDTRKIEKEGHLEAEEKACIEAY